MKLLTVKLLLFHTYWKEISFSETAKILELEISASTLGTSKLKDANHPTFGETVGHLELQKEVITFENLKHVQNYILAVSKMKI